MTPLSCSWAPRALPVLALMLTFSGVAAAGEALLADQLECFQIKDELGRSERRTVLATDLLPANPAFADQTCKIRLPASHLCVEAATAGLAIGSAPLAGLPVAGGVARKFLCYRMRCPHETVEVDARDQFAERVIHTKKGSFLCMPAEDASAATPTATVTASATPAPSATPTSTATATVTASPTATVTVRQTLRRPRPPRPRAHRRRRRPAPQP